jgi:hypothetical protein
MNPADERPSPADVRWLRRRVFSIIWLRRVEWPLSYGGLACMVAGAILCLKRQTPWDDVVLWTGVLLIWTSVWAGWAWRRLMGDSW